MCLNHALGGVEGVYVQHTYYGERRIALLRDDLFLFESGPRAAHPTTAPNTMWPTKLGSTVVAPICQGSASPKYIGSASELMAT